MTTPEKSLKLFVQAITNKLPTDRNKVYELAKSANANIAGRFLPLYFAFSGHMVLIGEHERRSKKSYLYALVSIIYGVFSLYLNVTKDSKS